MKLKKWFMALFATFFVLNMNAVTISAQQAIQDYCVLQVDRQQCSTKNGFLARAQDALVEAIEKTPKADITARKSILSMRGFDTEMVIRTILVEDFEVREPERWGFVTLRIVEWFELTNRYYQAVIFRPKMVAEVEAERSAKMTELKKELQARKLAGDLPKVTSFLEDYRKIAASVYERQGNTAKKD